MAGRKAWIGPDGLIADENGQTYQLVLTPSNLLGAYPLDDNSSQGETDQEGGPGKGHFDTSALDQT